MAMGGKNRSPSLGGMLLGGGGQKGGITPTPGTTEHALFMLVLLEVIALVALRRYMRSAHGG